RTHAERARINTHILADLLFAVSEIGARQNRPRTDFCRGDRGLLLLRSEAVPDARESEGTPRPAVGLYRCAFRCDGIHLQHTLCAANHLLPARRRPADIDGGISV